jgi:hypothetical protein
MPLLVPTVGENKLLEFALGFAVPGNQTLKLYVNNISPANGDTAGTYTEMSTHGYAAKTLLNGSWVVAQNAGEAEGTYAQQTWTFAAAAAVTVYGYFIIDSTTGVLLWAERFATSKVVEFVNDKILFTPKVTLSTKP